MIRRLTRLTSILVVFMALVGTTSVLAHESTYVPAPDVSSQLVAHKVISPAEQQAALAFWTREALAAVQPMEMPSQQGPAEIDTTVLPEQEVIGPPGFVAPGMAAPDADRVARAAYPDDWARLDDQGTESVAADLEGTSQVFTGYFAKDSALQRMYPHRWVGRLSFTTPDGTSSCSGSSISGNVMLTAAHCLYDSTNNRWYSNWVFTPAYRNGAAPYGTFAATQCWVLTAWINLNGNYAINTWAPHDVGVCTMGTNSSGQTLNYAVGWMGRQWNYSYIRHFHDLGYPFRNTSDQLITDAGKYLHICAAESFRQATEVRGMGCDMSRGKSGGPLMVGYAPTVVTGWADGVYSGFFIGVDNLYAARFNDNNIVPLCNAAGC
ncbi:MAG: trypsin-like serine protease [Chloroflexales bacterium]|nr:trypsin-like serine protease [Chloroflexales bacterium]